MRILKLFGVVCMGAAMAACDADQPLDASSVGGGAGNTVVQMAVTAKVATFGVWDWTEDTNGNGQLDLERDADGDGRLDSGEDINHNGVLDPGEDRNANGRLNFDEDLNSNGLLDRRPSDTFDCPQCEDLNINCILDPGEDLNNDGILWSEDIDCDGRLDGNNEDLNNNGVRDFEDTILVNSAIDAGLWCEGTAVHPTTGLLDTEAFIDGLVPVPLGGEVLRYTQGNPTPEVVAAVAGTGDGLTPYDTRVFGTAGNKTVQVQVGFCAGGSTPGRQCNDDTACGTGTCQFTQVQLPLTNGQVLPAGAPRLAFGDIAVSPSHWFDPNNSNLTNAPLCTVGLGFGQPNLGEPLPITVQTSPGDTISVRLITKQFGTFTAIDAANTFKLGASVSKDGTPLPPQGANTANIGESLSFHVAVP